MSVYANKITYEILKHFDTSFKCIFTFDGIPISQEEAEATVMEKTERVRANGDFVRNIKVKQIPLENIRMAELNVQEYLQLHYAMNMKDRDGRALF